MDDEIILTDLNFSRTVVFDSEVIPRKLSPLTVK